jgi:hypothetical protein
MKKVIDELKRMHDSVLGDSLLFVPGKITDPETGIRFDRKFHDPVLNEALIDYNNQVERSLHRLVSCAEEVCFYESMLNPEYLPNFDEEADFGTYLKLSFQGWLLKLTAILECAVHVANIIFELNIREESVKRKHVIDRMEFNPVIHGLLSQIDKLLTTEFTEIKNKDRHLRKIRDSIVHRNEFAHESDSVALYADIMKLDIIDLSEAELHGMIASINLKMLEQVGKFNYELMSIVYPFVGHMHNEYRKRFNERLK